MNPKNSDDKYFQYAATVALNYEKIKWNLERVSNIKLFLNKYNWKGINYSSKQMIGKRKRKLIRQLFLIFCILKKKKYVQLTSPKLIRIVKNN